MAIGLGEIALNSHLNQPLKAVIPIFDLPKMNANQLQATIATSREYTELGLARDAYLDTIQLTIKNHEGRTYIKISSPAPVVDPVLNLLICLTSPAGKFVRNYTLLLDPPSYQEAVKPKSTPINIESKPDAYSPQQTSALVQFRTYGPVKPNQTLWNVATELAPEISGNQLQLVWALYQANPRAFAYANINGLKGGTKLIVPSKQDIVNVNTAAAEAAIQQQGLDWKARINTRVISVKNNAAKNEIKLTSIPSISQFSNSQQTPGSTTNAIINSIPSPSTSMSQPEDILKDSHTVNTDVSSEFLDSDKAIASEVPERLTQQLALLRQDIDQLEQEICQNRAQIVQLKKQSNPLALELASSVPNIPSTAVVPITTTPLAMRDSNINTSLEKVITPAQPQMPKIPTSKPRVITVNYLFISLGVMLLLIVGGVIWFWIRQRQYRECGKSKSFFDNQLPNHQAANITESEQAPDLEVFVTQDTVAAPHSQTILSERNATSYSSEMEDAITNGTEPSVFNDIVEQQEKALEKTTATKLDLACVYIEMGDVAEAQKLLMEVIREGNQQQQASAQEMLNRLSS